MPEAHITDSLLSENPRPGEKVVVQRAHLRTTKLRHGSRWGNSGLLWFLMIAIALVSSMSCASVSNSRYVTGFDYDAPTIACRGADVNPETRRRELQKELLDYIAQSRDLRISVDVIDYETPSLIGTKTIGQTKLIQYLFAERLRTDVMLPGEGGVNIVIDACQQKIVYGNFFRYL